MNKKYRARQKIERDIARKQARKMRQPGYDDVFRYSHFVECLPKCLKGVRWKRSVQNYNLNALIRMYEDYKTLAGRKLPRQASPRRIVIYERGKQRIITPVYVKDRHVQKVLCDYALVPILSRHLIYDNGASMRGKGVEFTRKRLMKHLKEAVREFGHDFYALRFDFKSFFDSISHKSCRMILERYIVDPDIVTMAMDIIKSTSRSGTGICLGSQVSQIIALVIANDIDHYIKDVRGFRFDIRYMDDGIVMARTKEELQQLLGELKVICRRIGLAFNKKKTSIIRIRRGFTFLKVMYRVTDTGKIIRKLVRSGVVRMRRKLKKLKRKRVPLDDVYSSMQSWVAHSYIAMAYRARKNVLRLYNRLFDGYKIDRLRKRGKKHAVLQADKWAGYRWSGI